MARDLLGRWFVRRGEDGWRGVTLVETEAYVAGDPASHAFRGPTRRNASMFGPPGTLYVYRIHQVVCANLVTRPGEAVLLRAGAPLDAGGSDPSGPGRLCRYLGITHSDDGADVTVDGIRATDGPARPARVGVGPRIGISRAREAPLRFFVWGDPWVSRPRPWRRPVQRSFAQS